MQKTWIKICGITRAQDALAAAELGADAIGVNFYAPSPRAIEVERLPELLAGLPQGVDVVALFVDPTAELVRQVLATATVDLLQFHGIETAEFCEQFGMPYMKVVPVKPDSDLIAAIGEYSSAKYILLDSYDPVSHGGTGKTFDWSRVDLLSEEQRRTVVLAGGLQPDNVRTAVERVRPFGVDVSSGVEASKGIKDRGKMKSFIEGVRASG